MWNLPAIIDAFDRADENPMSYTGGWEFCNGYADAQLIGSTVRALTWNGAIGWDTQFGSLATVAIGAKIGSMPAYYNAEERIIGFCLRTSDTLPNLWNAHYYRIFVERESSTIWRVQYERYNQPTSSATDIGSNYIGSIVEGDILFAVSTPDGTQRVFVNGSLVSSMVDTTAGYYNIVGYAFYSLEYSAAGYQTSITDARIGTATEVPDYVPYFRVNLTIGTTPDSGGRYLYVRHRASGTYTTNYVYGMYSVGTLAQEATFLSVGSLWTIGTITIGSTIPNYGSIAVQTRIYVS